MRLVISFIVLLALAANYPCFAKVVHAQHGTRAGAAEKAATAKGASSNGANPVAAKSLDLDATVPPMPPRRGPAPHRNVNLGVKIVKPRNVAHGTGAATAPVVRNAIGQPIGQPKNLTRSLPHKPPALGMPATLQIPNARGALGSAPAASANAARPGAPSVSVANVAGRGSVNGAGFNRPAVAPSGLGGPAHPVYGINGTTVRSKH